MASDTYQHGADELSGDGTHREWIVGGLGVAGLLLLTLVAAGFGVTWKLIAISWAAFGAMALGAPLGARAATSNRPLEPVWGYGLASGAMITSAALFLIPQALGQHMRYGGLGIAVGFLAGYVGHMLGHRVSHLDLPIDRVSTELTAHAVTAGAIIGAIYAAMPSLTSILGIAMISHKGPAGYAAARRLADSGRSVAPLLLPAAAVGLIALPVGVVGFSPSPIVRGLFFGAAAGVFLHVAVDMLPECSAGSDTCPGTAQQVHQLRSHAAMSSIVGASAVVGAWLLI